MKTAFSNEISEERHPSISGARLGLTKDRPMAEKRSAAKGNSQDARDGTSGSAENRGGGAPDVICPVTPS